MTDDYGDQGDLCHHRGSQRTLTLVRPDAYVAWAADTTSDGAAGQAGPWQQATSDDAALAEHAVEIRDALARWCGVPAPAVPRPPSA